MGSFINLGAGLLQYGDGALGSQQPSAWQRLGAFADNLGNLGLKVIGPGTFAGEAVVRPFYNLVGALADTPLGDPGVGLSIEQASVGAPPLLIAAGEADGVFLNIAARGLQTVSEWGSALRAGESEAPEVLQLGGAYRDVRGIPGYEAHHMPADSISPLSTSEGPSIAMPIEDHRLTASWGNSRGAQAYRQTQADLIGQGDFQGAQQMDISDITEKFGKKYNEQFSKC